MRAGGDPARVWDLAVVGSGPAGAAAALAARRAAPGLRVALVDAASFPRDKPCGDGIAPHVLDLLATVGLGDVLHDWVPVHVLRLSRGAATVVGTMQRPAWVVPRAVFDARLHRAAVDAGAEPVRARVREVDATAPDGPVALRLRGGAVLRARTVVGADGAHSVVGRAVPTRPGPVALALRGYAPVAPHRAGEQVIRFGTDRQPAYAWSFDRGDGLANVGYGEVLHPDRSAPTRSDLLAGLDTLLPGATADGTGWRGHHLPLSTARPLRPGRGRVLLAGDAAGLVNPLTGEGIYYAVATGLLAGRVAADAVRTGSTDRAARRHTRLCRQLLGGHLRHTALAAALTRSDLLLEAGLRAADADRGVFDDLVELGLARGRITVRTAAVLAGSLAGRSGDARPRRPRAERVSLDTRRSEQEG